MKWDLEIHFATFGDARLFAGHGAVIGFSVREVHHTSAGVLSIALARSVSVALPYSTSLALVGITPVWLAPH